MILDASILLVATMAAGLLAFYIPKVNTKLYSLALVFGGSYLFSITIVHILPELFSHGGDIKMVAFWVLFGFFIQVVLEYFTQGVEHGHLHHASEQHSHGASTSVSLLIALFIHAFLEGTLLAHPDTLHADHQGTSLLIGILLHKLPAAFALMSVLLCHFQEKWKSIALLSIFALASPIGLALSGSLLNQSLIPEHGFVVLFAIVSGNFLHISTTIFFESSPDHRFHLRKLIISIFGAAVAVIAEMFL